MKAKLIYNLPDDQSDYLQAVHATDMAMALWDMNEYLRSQERYEGKDDIYKIRQAFIDILNENDVNLDILIS